MFIDIFIFLSLLAISKNIGIDTFEIQKYRYVSIDIYRQYSHHYNPNLACNELEHGPETRHKLGVSDMSIRNFVRTGFQVRCENDRLLVRRQVVRCAASPGHSISRWRTKSATPQNEHIGHSQHSRI